MRPIAWLRAKFGLPGSNEDQPSKDENVEMGNLGDKEEEEILSKLDRLIDAAIDMGGKAALKALGEKLNTRV